MNRRDLFKAAGVAAGTAAGAGGVLVVAKAARCLAGDACPALTGSERVSAALTELVSALLAAHPGVTFANTVYFPQGNGNLYLGLMAYDGSDNAVA